MKIELLDMHSEFLGLIIPYNTGVTYTNQVGGTAIMHPEVEGFYIPLPHCWLTEDHRGTVQGFVRTNNTSSDPEELHDLVRKFLSADGGTLKTWFSVPKITLEMVAEAWVPVVIVEDRNFPFTVPIAGLLGYLTWNNSD